MKDDNTIDPSDIQIGDEIKALIKKREGTYKSALVITALSKVRDSWRTCKQAIMNNVSKTIYFFYHALKWCRENPMVLSTFVLAISTSYLAFVTYDMNITSKQEFELINRPWINVIPCDERNLECIYINSIQFQIVNIGKTPSNVNLSYRIKLDNYSSELYYSIVRKTMFIENMKYQLKLNNYSTSELDYSSFSNMFTMFPNERILLFEREITYDVDVENVTIYNFKTKGTSYNASYIRSGKFCFDVVYDTKKSTKGCYDIFYDIGLKKIIYVQSRFVRGLDLETNMETSIPAFIIDNDNFEISDYIDLFIRGEINF